MTNCSWGFGLMIFCITVVQLTVLIAPLEQTLVRQGVGKVTSYVTPIYKTGKETVITFDFPVLALIVVLSVAEL